MRVITRIEWPDPEVDVALIDLAAAGSVTDLERVVRFYRCHQDQHRPPPDVLDRRGLRIQPGLDGTATVEIVLDATEAAELTEAIQAFIDLGAVEQPPAGDSSERPAPDERCWPARRADAFMDLMRTGLAHAGEGHAVGADRYLVHVVQRVGSAPELLDGTPIDDATAEGVACDSSSVTHFVGDSRELLALGRRTRAWSTGQRRAISVRDGGQCRTELLGRD